MKKVFLKIVKSIIVIIFIIIAISAYLYMFHRYRYESSARLDFDQDGILNINDDDIDGDGVINMLDNDADGDGIENIADIINTARNMKGTLYDFTQGRYNNLAGKMGFLVCIDIPRISYQEAGIYFEKILKDDFQQNEKFYNTENGINTPLSSFFYRRTRNLYRYCELNNKLIKNCSQPEPGDLVFYGRFHIALITEVHNDGTYNELETAPGTIFAVEHIKKEWKAMDIGRIFTE